MTSVDAAVPTSQLDEAESATLRKSTRYVADPIKNDSFSVYGNIIMNNGAFKEGDITFLFEKDGSLMKGCKIVSQKEAESLYNELVKKQKRRFGFKGE